MQTLGRRRVVAGLSVAIALLPLPTQVTATYLDPTLDRHEEQESNADGGSDDAYDPMEGLAADGSIPGISRPSYLAHPDRWRYVPEGRLKPGNVFQRFFVSSFITPYAFSSSDIGTGFGLTLADLDFRGSRRQEFLAALVSYSTEGQQAYELKWRRWLNHLELADGGILREERSQLQVEAGFNDTLTLRFFGLGPDTEHEDETSYSDRNIFADVGLDRSIPEPGANWVVHGGLRFESHQLRSGKAHGMPSMDDEYPLIFAASDERLMGWLRAGLRYDTRDSQENPYGGWHVDVLASWVPAQSQGGMGGLLTLRGSKIFRLFPLLHDGGYEGEENPPTDTLGFGLWNEYALGDLPFYSLPSLGGPERHRGFIAGRFRGRASWLAAAEYRFWILPRGLAFTRAIRLERIGAALFYEAGAVADEAAQLLSSKVRHSYGVSLRLSFERTAPFRFDFGFSQQHMEFSVGYGLSF